jgi:hypothetical protein
MKRVMERREKHARTDFRRVTPICLLLGGLTACGPDALLGPGAPQGIEGLVLVGPQCPVESPEDPCPDLPYEATIEVRDRGGDSVARVRSDADGAFRVGLRPGSYTLVPESGAPFPSAGPQDVDVSEGRYSEVTIRFDTGIR